MFFSGQESHGIQWLVRETEKGLENSGNLEINGKSSLQKNILSRHSSHIFLLTGGHSE